MRDRTFLTVDKAISGELLRDASLLLFRGSSGIARAIQIGGRGEYSHAAMLVWFRDEPFVAEVRELYGGRLVTLRSQVQRHSGKIDVYHAGFNGLADVWRGDRPGVAVRRMTAFAGCDYGWWSVIQAAFYHLPFVRTRLDPPTDDDAEPTGLPPFCSQAVAMAYKAAGVDVVHNLSDQYTEPNDLARSRFFRYACTLVTE